MGYNKFMDLTASEFSQMYKGFIPELSKDSHVENLKDDNLPESVDWRTGAQVAVGPVKEQGQCGSCWAFSTVGSLEGLSALFGDKKLQSFSESQLVDCSTSYHNHGCGGGLMDNAFKFVINYGIATEEEYPYKPVDGACKTKGGQNFRIHDFKDVSRGSVSQLAAAVVNQPISVAVDANNF